MKAHKNEGNNMKNDHESRIVRLEVTIESINQTLIRFEKRFDSIDKRFDKLETDMKYNFESMNSRFETINNRMWSNFLWLLSAMFLFSGILCGIMAKGFHWFS